MGVGHIITIHFRSITLHLILADAVNDLFPVSINFQVLKIPAPVAAFVYRYAADRLAVRKQVDDDLIRTDSILVVLVIPGL